MVRARLRRLRFAVLGLVASVVILLGVLAGLTHLAMPWLASHPQSVARWLGERLGRSVTIGQLQGGWVGGGPRLDLKDVRIGGADPAQAPIRIPSAQLSFDLLAPLRRGRAFSEFHVEGLDLQLVKEADAWHLHGLDLGDTQPRAESFSMGALGALQVNSARVRIEDAAHGLQLDLVVPVLRLVNHGASTRVLARVAPRAAEAAMLDLVADLDPGSNSGTVYLGSRDVDLAALLGTLSPGGVQVTRGRGVVQLWLGLKGGVPESAHARIDLRNAGFAAATPLKAAAKVEIAPRAAFDRLGLVARWQRGDAGWTLDVANLIATAEDKGPVARLRIECRDNGGQPQWIAVARDLPLEPLGALAMLAQPLPDSLRQWLYLAHPRGQLESATLQWRSAEDHDLDLHVRSAEIAAAGSVPGVAALDLDVFGDGQAVLVQIPEQAARVSVPKVFRWPFEFTRIGGDIDLRRTDAGAWRVETDALAFDAVDFGGELRGGVQITAGRRPFLDLYAVTQHADVAAAKRFWPVNVMPPTAVEWLDRGLVDGKVVDGRVAFRGDLADWPFHNQAGYFIARAEVDDTTLVYHPQWPRAQGIHAVAQFINTGMQVDAQAGKTMGNSIQSASATIADFGDVLLELEVKAAGSAGNLLNFLRDTPIGRRYAEPLKDLVVDGKFDGGFKLVLPVHDTQQMTLVGNAVLNARKLEQLRYDQHFVDVSGSVRFSQSGLAADLLDVGFRGRRAKLSIDVGSFVVDPAQVFEARLSGLFPASEVFADMPVLAPVVARLRGESVWNALVSVAPLDSGEAAVRLAIDSNLIGTAIDLPAPLDKLAAASWPLHIALNLPYAGQLAQVQLFDRLAISAQLPADDKAFAMRLRFGAGDAGAPPAAGMLIDGRITQFDAGGWIALLNDGQTGAGLLLPQVDVRADEALLGGRQFKDVGLHIDNSLTATRVTLDGAAIAGELDFPHGAGSRGIVARLARVHWPDAPPGAADGSMMAAVAPASVPPIDLQVEDFRLGEAMFGRARFKSHPDGSRMVVESIETQSPNVSMKASGEWSGTAGANQSRMQILLQAQSLGQMMDALGYPGLIDGGKTRATIDASWPGPPTAFALANLDGSLDIDIAEGRIPDAHPGAGRIFGLLSITEIPRRLSLDFSDFFRSGLSFNSIKGKFNLADGNAYTDGLHLDSPAAEIVLTGRTGLRARDYDQRLDVQPRAGAALPLIGAAAGGPVGAAAGLVVQGILNKPISKAVARQYVVTGSWEKPVFTPVAAARRKAPAKKS